MGEVKSESGRRNHQFLCYFHPTYNMIKIGLLLLLACIAHNGAVEVSQGTCESVSKDECFKLAKSKGILGVDIHLTATPSGCYYKPKSKVIFFNTASSNARCTSVRNCVCKQQ